MITLLYLFFGLVHSQCESGWKEYNGNCYKHFDTPNNRGTYDVIRGRCKSLGGDIASGAREDERDFMEQMNKATLPGGSYPPYHTYRDHLIFGVNLNPSDRSYRTVIPGEKVYGKFIWCKQDVVRNSVYPPINEPNYYNNNEFCHFIYGFPWPPYYCMCDIDCGREWRRYICQKKKPQPPPLVCKENAMAQNGKCVCKPGFVDIRSTTDPNRNNFKPGEKCIKPVVCTDPNAQLQNNRCVCKQGFVDIRDTEDLDRNKYKEGEKCVPEDPCHNLKRPLSLIFIVDASQSIQARNWPSLVEFLKAGANYIPSQTNVGFIKFSTTVTFAEWLPMKWSQREFQQIVPTDFDAGYTNTPAAIEKAIEMFDEVGSNSEKVAVLITDGLPVVDEQTDKEKALADTRQAVSKLHRKGIDLVALGFGPELKQQKGDTYIKKWLQDPNQDYFSFERMACDLRNVHMQMVLQKVCRRYV